MKVRRFAAMGCTIEVGGATDAEARRIERLFAQRDRRFSRFLENSELNRVNDAAARVVSVSREFARMAELALRSAAATDGLVDPTLGDAIQAAGYDRDFERLEPRPEPVAPGEPGRWHAVRLSGLLLSRPPGLLLDLNGVVKGQTVDDALGLIDGEGFVSAGGDYAGKGQHAVGLPSGGAVQVTHGGLATSGVTKRRWLRAGDWQHHLIDPRTGRPAAGPWLEVTVSAATCVQADVAAKAAFLLGTEGPAWLQGRGLAGRFVRTGGDPVLNDAWREALAA